MSARPPGFIYKHNELCCENIPLRDLGAKYGTPLYVYSAKTIRERYRTLDHAFSHVRHTICYSVKANSNLSILRLLARQGCGWESVVHAAICLFVGRTITRGA